MAVNRDVVGIKEVLKDLDDLVNDEMIDTALTAGAEVIARRLRNNFETFKDTGASIEEITISEPYDNNGQRAVKIHWRGSKHRYRIIHLNEWGTIRKPKPRGLGMVQKAMREGEYEYYKVLRDEIEKGLK